MTYRTILKRRIRKGVTVDTSRSTSSEFTRGNAASVICRRLRHLFFLYPAGISSVVAHRRRCISAVAFPRCVCAMRCDENSRMHSAAGCSLHNAVVTYRACISLPGRGLTANTAGHRPIFSRDSSINGNVVISCYTTRRLYRTF